MRLRARNGFLTLVTAALVVVAVGCPSSTTITSGVGRAQLEIIMANPSRFDLGFINIDRLLIRPVDASAGQVLGDRDIPLLPFGAFIDTSMPMVDPLFLDATQLAQGVYEVVEIEFSQLFFIDQDLPTDPSTCESYQFIYEPRVPGPSGFPITARITATNFAVPQQFTVLDAQDTALTLTFDLTQLMTTLHNAYTCSPGCGAFCISNFDPFQFAADTLNYLTFE